VFHYPPPPTPPPQALLGPKVDGKLTMPNMPDLLTGPPDDPDSITLALPDNSSVLPPSMPGLDLSRGVAAAVPGERGGDWGLVGFRG
jgi:hypothetical protein